MDLIRVIEEQLYLMLFECEKFEIPFNETVAKWLPEKCLGFLSNMRCDGPSI